MNTENLNLSKESVILRKDKLDKIIKEHDRVLDFITNLNRDLKKEAFVPACENFAYFKGNIINTNECRVYLGEDYFVKTTNHRAMQIINNRKTKVESLIEEVNKQLRDLGVEVPKVISKLDEKNQPEKKSEIKNDTQDSKNNISLKSLGNDTFEILEDFNENEETPENKNKFLKKTPLQEDTNKLLNDKLQKLIQNRNLQTDEVSEVLKPVISKINKTELIQPNNKKKDVVTLQGMQVPKSYNDNSAQYSEEEPAKRSLFYLHDEDLDDEEIDD
jgi:prefoldin alpha subunit